MPKILYERSHLSVPSAFKARCPEGWSFHTDELQRQKIDVHETWCVGRGTIEKKFFLPRPPLNLNRFRATAPRKWSCWDHFGVFDLAII